MQVDAKPSEAKQGAGPPGVSLLHRVTQIHARRMKRKLLEGTRRNRTCRLHFKVLGSCACGPDMYEKQQPAAWPWSFTWKQDSLHVLAGRISVHVASIDGPDEGVVKHNAR